MSSCVAGRASAGSTSSVVTASKGLQFKQRPSRTTSVISNGYHLEQFLLEALTATRQAFTALSTLFLQLLLGHD